MGLLRKVLGSIGGVFSGGSITGYVIVALLVALGLTGGFAWVERKDITALNAAVATKDADIAKSEAARRADLNSFRSAESELKSTIAVLQEQRKEDQRQILNLGAENARISADADRVKAKAASEVNTLRDALAKRPALLGAAYTAGLSRMFDEFERASAADPDHQGGEAAAGVRPAAAAADRVAR